MKNLYEHHNLILCRIEVSLLSEERVARYLYQYLHLKIKENINDKNLLISISIETQNLMIYQRI
ncbi:MAG: hypothetical protein AB8Y49_02395, partial [Coxiella-like endosymbiont]